MKAKFIKSMDNFKGNAALYRVEPAVNVSYDSDDKTNFVVVSAVNNTWAHETYMFPAAEDGQILSWEEMYGSMKDTTSHEEVLNAAGYTLE